MLKEVQVLIVGAGPTGLMAALCLARMGISFEIIDKKPFPVDTSNALAIQPRTLEIFDDFDLAKEAITWGHQLKGLQVRNYAKPLFQMNYSGLNTPFPFLLVLPQSLTESLLLQKLKRYKVKIQRPYKLISLKKKSDHIMALVAHKKQKIQYKAKWVLGCDGKNSTVRELLGIDYLGEQLQQKFMLADVEITGKINKKFAHMHFSKYGPLIIIPGSDFYRIIVETTHEPRLYRAKKPSIKHFQYALYRRSRRKVKITRLKWMSQFSIYKHLADKITDDEKIFLLGDAAHEHSPVGGQGMNMGIQDAYNLCWKITCVIKHNVPLNYLSSYQSERLPVAQKVVDSTSKLTKLISTEIKSYNVVKKILVKFINKSKRIKNRMIYSLSQLAINYKKPGFFKRHSTHQYAPGTRIPTQMKIDRKKPFDLRQYIAQDKFTLLMHADDITYDDWEIFQSFIKSDSILFKQILLSSENNTLLKNLNTINPIIFDEVLSAFTHSLSLKPREYILIRPDYVVEHYGTLTDGDKIRTFLEDIHSR